MAVKTTLHLQRTIADALDAKAEEMGLSRSELVMLLAYNQMMKFEKHAALLQVVRYQARNAEGEWKTVHIAINESDYVFLVEMRCFYKMSVSYIINMALCELLYSKYCIINKKFIRHFRDKNYFNGHGMIADLKKASICWRIFWNLPPEPEKIFTF